MVSDKQGSKSNILILVLIISVCLSIPIVYFLFNQDSPDASDQNEIVGSDGKVRDDYDPGIAWLQSKPIMMPNSYGGFNTLRATLRMKDRESAKTVCDRHPHLADTILTVLTENKGLMEEALNGASLARYEINQAISERLGADLFTETMLSDESLDLMKDTDKVRYECGRDGLRLIFRNPPKGLKQN